MASTSSSSIQKSFKYDVFLSFRGGDTRNNFVGHLYEALQRSSIETYKDDKKIEQGKPIKDQLFKSIEDSRFYIIVFSKTYASSSWCLDELVKIMECNKTTDQNVYPVFFDVEPTEVRKQSGAVKEAFAEHEKKEAAEKWREAMKEASDLAGWDLKDRDESKLIQKIVDVIFKKKYSTLSNADGNLVGMETRIRNVLSSLDIGTEDVRMIGIKGMGGGGKTTLARAIYDQISNQFEGKSFVENVRELSKPTSPGLKKLQTKILEDVLNRKDITFSSVHDGKNMLKDMMSRRKILVILDDVDCIEQLRALAGEPCWFKSGSRVIITARDEQVLLAHGVNKFIHDVNLLSPTEAIFLFSRYAFKRDIPTQGYEELSGQVVQYAHGLPLTIKVLGSHLRDQKEPVWIDAIKRLKSIPLEETMKRLEISLDGLGNDFKEIFFDVACILKGWYKEDAIRVLESRGFYAIYGLRVLEQKSLITISKYEVLGMHDHLEEMGRNIVRRSHPDESQRHSRLWINEEIEDILTNGLGTQATKCLFLDSDDFSAEIAVKGLAKMKDLRFVFMNLYKDYFMGYKSNIVEFDKVSEYLPSSLRYMRWVEFPFSSLPNTFQGKYLVGLDIRRSNIVQLWEDGEGKVLPNLRFLIIGFSKLRTFDLRLAPNLEQLTIYYCQDFVELHMPAESVKLEEVNLSHSKLRILDLGLTPNLKRLNLKNCYDLVEINAPVGCLKNLLFLDLSGCGRFKSFVFDKRYQPAEAGSLSELHLIAEPTDVCPLHCNNDSPKFQFSCYYIEDKASSFGNLERLIYLGLCACTNLERFSRCICGLQCLRKLTLEGSIPEVPKDLDRLVFLEELKFSSTDIKILPDSICMLNQLKSLEIVSCWFLEKLPEDLGRLQCLEKLILSDCKVLQDLPNSMCKMKSLISLYLAECHRIMKLPEEMGRLGCLKELDITRSSISYLPTGIFQLKGLRIVGEDQIQLRSSGSTSKIQISENEATVTITGTQSSSRVSRGQRRKQLN